LPARFHLLRVSYHSSLRRKRDNPGLCRKLDEAESSSCISFLSFRAVKDGKRRALLTARLLRKQNDDLAVTLFVSHCERSEAIPELTLSCWGKEVRLLRKRKYDLAVTRQGSLRGPLFCHCEERKRRSSPPLLSLRAKRSSLNTVKSKTASETNIRPRSDEEKDETTTPQ
jgi:hypothetical protein